MFAWRENLILSLRQIWAHKLRSFLTMLSLTIGAASIVAMTSLAGSGFDTLTRGIEDIGGTRFIAVFHDQPKHGHADRYTRWLTMGDRDALAKHVPDLEAIVASKKFYHFPIEGAEGRETDTTVVATEPSYFSAYKMALAEGRMLTPDDQIHHRRVAVIGHALASTLFGGQDPLGQELVFQGSRYTVIGMLVSNPKPNINLGYAWDQVIVIPVTSPDVGSDLEQIDMVVKRTQDADLAVRVANAVLLHRHRGVDNYMIFEFAGLLKNFYLAFSIMQAVVALVACLALLIGGVGVMNIMLVAVTERMREIGLRKALGASRAMIRNQFLTESMALSLIGASLGVGLGYGIWRLAGEFIRRLSPAWVESFSPGAVVVALAASLASGVFFGWLPAQRASELEPIQCLRHE